MPPRVTGIEKFSNTPPKVTYITTANQPKIVRAGAPILKKDTTNGGTPYFTNYGMEQGLPNNTIAKGTIEDSAGNLWFGTPKGVSRYDGKKFTNYSVVNGLPQGDVWGIAQDNNGNIWFGKGISVVKYDGKAFIKYDKSSGLVGDFVNCIMQDRNGRIWFGTDGGVSRYDKKTFTNYTTKQGLIDNVIRCMIQDKKGSVWFGTYHGVCKYEGKRFINYNDSLKFMGDHAQIESILQDSKGNLWFSVWGQGVIRYDGSKYANFGSAQGLGDNKIRHIMEDREGNIWFSTYSGGASKYDGKKFINYNTVQGLSDNSIRSVFEDRGGDLWFNTVGGGLSKLSTMALTFYTSSKWLPAYDIRKMMIDKKGNIWIGSSRGFTKYDGRNFITYSTSQGLVASGTGQNREGVYNIMEDRSGNMWFGRYGGLNKFDGQNFTYYSTSQGLQCDYAQILFQDTKNNIWIGTGSNGVYKYDGKSFTNYDTAQGLAAHLVSSIIEDKSGNLWFGTISGVRKYDGKFFTSYNTFQGLASDTVVCMALGSNGEIWFGTSRGVSRYDGIKFTSYTTESGLSDNAIDAILPDSVRKILWIATDNGLSLIKLDSLSNSPGNAFETFNVNTGYPITNIYWESLCLDSAGLLWFACEDNKIMKFDYALASRNKTPLSIIIQTVKVDNEYICWNNLQRGANAGSANDSLSLLSEMGTTFGKSLSQSTLDSMRNKLSGIKFDSISRFNPVPINLVLPYKDNSISIEYVAIESSMPRQVKYQYMLEGYDKAWGPISNSTTAVFGNIPEGNYTFKLKALSPRGIWSETEYKFKVLSPWYRTWWAYILYVLLFGGTIWGLIYYRSEQLRRENRILEEKVNLRTRQLKEEKDKVESALTNLKSTQSQLIQSEKMASLGELTAGIAHEIQNPLNFVNNFSDLNSELVDEITQEIDKGNTGEAKKILNDLKANEEKINHHGKRADAIVKGMLQHSRSGTAAKEITDINKLADEYLRLSYHGFRAKGKIFDAKLLTDFDSSVGKIDVVPQDIGKVLLNLINNAFYAVYEKGKSASENYEATVAIKTKRTLNHIVVTVSDNGNGIPENMIDKIFQPFFTSKPTGEGTGLGLSLSYDIIKAHGGEIKVNTKEGKFTEFTIQLPV